MYWLAGSDLTRAWFGPDKRSRPTLLACGEQRPSMFEANEKKPADAG
ncbi:hypothetical protein QF000_001509 [Paraburkholderia atlantica]